LALHHSYVTYGSFIFPADILAEIPAPLVQSIAQHDFFNCSHFGRVSGQSCAENAQDKSPTFAMLDDFRFVFWRSFFMGVIFQILAAQFIFG
jgi:hypothetical protein